MNEFNSSKIQLAFKALELNQGHSESVKVKLHLKCNALSTLS